MYGATIKVITSSWSFTGKTCLHHSPLDLATWQLLKVNPEKAPFLPGTQASLPFTRVGLSLNNHQHLNRMTVPAWPMLKFSRKGRIGILVQMLNECARLPVQRSDFLQPAREPDRVTPHPALSQRTVERCLDEEHLSECAEEGDTGSSTEGSRIIQTLPGGTGFACLQTKNLLQCCQLSTIHRQEGSTHRIKGRYHKRCAVRTVFDLMNNFSPNL